MGRTSRLRPDWGSLEGGVWPRDQARGKARAGASEDGQATAGGGMGAGRHVRDRKKVEIRLACCENCTSFLRLPESGAGGGPRGGQGALATERGPHPVRSGGSPTGCEG